MPEIPFTQFLRPDGRRKDTWIDMPVEFELQARRFFRLSTQWPASHTGFQVQGAGFTNPAPRTLNSEPNPEP